MGTSVDLAWVTYQDGSMALRLELQDAEQTLTDERIDATVAAAVARAAERVGGRIRA